MKKLKVKVEIWGLVESRDKSVGDKGHMAFEEDIIPGMTVLDLFEQLADRYQYVRKSVSDAISQRFYSHFVIVLNGRIAKTNEALRRPLKDGDDIILLPYLVGG